MYKLIFDREWQFHPGDFPDSRFQEPDASNWRIVDLPHDWSIEHKPDPASPCGDAGGYFPMGLGWYYKSFEVPEEWRGKKVFIEFEGVYMNAETWLNCDFLGRHPYGYTSFCYDLTDYLKYGSENSIRIMVDNACQPNSRWYSGSGIYRHVRLLVGNEMHFGHWGMWVDTLEVTDNAAAISVNITVMNESIYSREAVVRARIIAPNGAVVMEFDTCKAINSGGSEACIKEIKLDHPQLWSPDTPNLYTLKAEIIYGDEILDSEAVSFGIRSIYFDAGKGFLLNKRPVKLKGGCIHHDNGILGAASFDRAEERKVELLKAGGFNAVRCAHNPPAPAFLDACDRLGMLVIDEAFDCWRDGKNPYDYHVCFDDWWARDIDSMINRDRKHPCVIMWSIGNELNERDGRSGGEKIARMLSEHVRSVDPARPVTAGIVGGSKWPWRRTDSIFNTLDVCGYNYACKNYVTDHELYPDRVVYGSESTPGEAFEHWMGVLELNHVIGDFVWTALDYLGEAGIGRMYYKEDNESLFGKYPWHHANCGDMDICGFKRPQSYYRDILWQNSTGPFIAVHAPVLPDKTPDVTHWGWPDVLSSWTWPGYENRLFTVDVYSACEKVELFLNGRSLGIKPAGSGEKFLAAFKVPYKPGCLKAVGHFEDGRITVNEIRTAGKPAGIRLIPDRSILKAEFGDLSFITVELVDREGLVNFVADNTVYFTVMGEGSIAAVGSSNPVSTEYYKGNRRNAYRGRCMVVVKSHGIPGEIYLRAQADCLETTETVIRVN